MTTPLRTLSEAGQSVWLDFLSRGLLESGDLRRLIEDDDLGGVTSNPSIFEKAIGDGAAYDEALRAVIEAGDAEAISAKTATLMQASMKLGEAMYQAQQGEAAAGPAAEPADDGVVDAEFEEVKDDKQSA